MAVPAPQHTLPVFRISSDKSTPGTEDFIRQAYSWHRPDDEGKKTRIRQAKQSMEGLSRDNVTSRLAPTMSLTLNPIGTDYQLLH